MSCFLIIRDATWKIEKGCSFLTTGFRILSESESVWGPAHFWSAFKSIGRRDSEQLKDCHDNSLGILAPVTENLSEVREPFSDSVCPLDRSRNEMPGSKEVQTTVLETGVIDDGCTLLAIQEPPFSSPSLSAVCLGKTSSHDLNKSQMSTGAGMSVGAKLQQVCSVMVILLGFTRPGTGVQIQSIATSVTATCQSPDCKGIQTWSNHSSWVSQVHEVQWLAFPQSLVLVLLSAPRAPMQRRMGPGWSPRLPSKDQAQLLQKQQPDTAQLMLLLAGQTATELHSRGYFQSRYQQYKYQFLASNTL